MTEEQKKTMEQFGITYETKTIFYFQGHRYDHLDDAIKYAKKGCMIYRNRPLICREFEVGGQDCLAARATPLTLR